ncbi:MAG: ATP-binding protein, partial [Desulfobulbaceae bacterium]|nr:ATP-binding protein [Desulfobulbaceae bacterium]
AMMVGQMEEKVATSKRIVNRILPLAQLYWDTHGEAVSIVDIAELELEIMSADNFFKHNIDKHFDLALDLPRIKKHCVELHTLIHVLLDNAAYALREALNPWMLLSAKCSGESLVLAVSDSGSGVDADVATWIFEPFYSTRDGALGVGLFLAKKCVGIMGGRIEYSAEDGKTTFTVTVPFKELI